MSTLLALSGLVATVWLIAGVVIAARHYPSYSHTKQFCSELGAEGNPTQTLSPLINNYPLSLLFAIFGVFIFKNQPEYTSWAIIGWMIVAHGVGTLIAGYFPMDRDPYTTQPTFSCKIHSAAGFVMMVSLLIAPVTATLSATFPLWFRLLSIASVFGCIAFSISLAKAYKNKTNPGLHQRISYGFQLAWLAVLSLYLANQ